MTYTEFDDVVADDIDLLFEGDRFDSRPFKLDYLVVGDRPGKNITIVPNILLHGGFRCA